MQVVPYLMFNGNAEDAIQFYTQALHGTVEMLQRYEDAPVSTTDSEKQKVMHATVVLGDGTRLMFSDTNDKRAVEFGTNIHLSLDFSGEAEINAAFQALSEGAQITMPLEDTFWGARFGMLTDKFGICWMFNWDKPGAHGANNG